MIERAFQVNDIYVHRWPRFRGVALAGAVRPARKLPSRISACAIGAICKCSRSSPGRTKNISSQMPRLANFARKGTTTPQRIARCCGRGNTNSSPRSCPNIGSLQARGQIEISTTPYLPSDSSACLRYRHRARLKSSHAVATSGVSLSRGRERTSAARRENTTRKFSASRLRACGRRKVGLRSVARNRDGTRLQVVRHG